MNLKRDGMNWEHDETVLALELYFRTPYGSIHAHNPEIIQLASLLQRKPGAVAYKMGNLASLDPELRASGRKGLSNGAKIDKLVFDEYYLNWNKLVLDSEMIKASLINGTLLSIGTDQSFPYRSLLGSEVEGKTKVRVGQRFFHDAICSEYNNRCCVTGIAEASLLQAAHIKPWKDCTADEKTSPSNGLCLNPLHHILFDKGLFTLNDELRIVMSKAFTKQKMDTATKEWLWSYDNRQIEMPDRYQPDMRFVHFHQANIFLG